MAELVTTIASTDRGIREMVKDVTNMEIPYKGKIREGTAPVFAYKVETWIFKTKKECMPVLIQYLKDNTEEISGSVRPIQGVTNGAAWFLSFVINIRNKYTRFMNVVRRRKYRNIHPGGFNTVKMSDFKKGKARVPGWRYSKVWGWFPDHYNSNGEEEL
jgi:hypothetical protein